MDAIERFESALPDSQRLAQDPGDTAALRDYVSQYLAAVAQLEGARDELRRRAADEREQMDKVAANQSHQPADSPDDVRAHFSAELAHIQSELDAAVAPSKRADVERHWRKVCDARATLAYGRFLARVESADQSLRQCEVHGVSAHFGELAELRRSIDGTECAPVLEYLDGVMAVWRKHGAERILAAVGKLLAKFDWPLEQESALKAADADVAALADLLVDYYLLHADMLCEQDAADADAPLAGPSSARFAVDDGDDGDSGPQSALSALAGALVAPMERRFRFHFYGARGTNRADKPEWFYAQLLQWATVHRRFLQRNVTPKLRARGCHWPLADCLAVRLAALAREKLENALQAGHLLDDSAGLTHVIDETVAFEMEWAHALDIEPGCGSPAAPRCCDVLAAGADRLQAWLQLERLGAQANAERALTDAAAFEGRYDVQGLDPYKVPRCADDFLLSVELVAERGRLLAAAEHRVHFLGVQLELLDDFRLRLLNVYRSLAGPGDDKYCPLMNAVWYIAETLEDWDYRPFYANLQRYQSGSAASGGPFTSVASLYRLLWTNMRTELIRRTVERDVAPVLDVYARHRWWAAKDYASGAPTAAALSSSVCPLLVNVRDALAAMETGLCERGYRSAAAAALADCVARLMVDKVLLVGDFGALGGLQLACDVHDGLLPLLRAYNAAGGGARSEPGLYSVDVSQLAECVKVLALSTASATLLRSALCAGDVDEASLGADFDICLVPLQRVRQLLARRADLPRAGVA